MPLFKDKGDARLELILDIQSAVVRGSLVVYESGQAPHIVYTYNVNLPWKSDSDTGFIVKKTLKAISETVDASKRFMHMKTGTDNMPRRIRKVHLVLASPWVVSEAKTFQSETAKEETVTKSKILSLIAESHAKLTSSKTDDVEVIEQKIFDVRLNGYSVSQWAGRQAKKLEVSYAVSIMSARMAKEFRTLCSHSARGAEVMFHSSLLLQHIGFRAVRPDLADYCLVHVHGELTDVAVIINHSTHFFGSYAVGVRTLVRNIARSANCDDQAADSLLTLYVGGHMDREHADNAMTLIRSEGEYWAKELKNMLTAATAETGLVRKIFVVSWSHDDFFYNIITDALPEAKTELISIEDIAPHISYSEKAEKRRLSSLYTLALHIMDES